jgi:hypothetical protein
VEAPADTLILAIVNRHERQWICFGRSLNLPGTAPLGTKQSLGYYRIGNRLSFDFAYPLEPVLSIDFRFSALPNPSFRANWSIRFLSYD